MVPPLRRGDRCVPSPVGTGEGQGGGSTHSLIKFATFIKGRGRGLGPTHLDHRGLSERNAAGCGAVAAVELGAAVVGTLLQARPGHEAG